MRNEKLYEILANNYDKLTKSELTAILDILNRKTMRRYFGEEFLEEVALALKEGRLEDGSLVKFMDALDKLSQIDLHELSKLNFLASAKTDYSKLLEIVSYVSEMRRLLDKTEQEPTIGM